MSSCLIQLGAGFSGCPRHSNSTSPPGGLEESSIGTSCEERREGARRKRGSALAARSLCEGYSRSVLIVVAVDRTLASGGRGNTRCVARTLVRLASALRAVERLKKARSRPSAMRRAFREACGVISSTRSSSQRAKARAILSLLRRSRGRRWKYTWPGAHVIHRGRPTTSAFCGCGRPTL